MKARIKAAVARRSATSLRPAAATLWRTVARWKEHKANPPPPPQTIWCLVANVAEVQHYGPEQEERRGTKHFSPNTKVYVYPRVHGDTVKVIGRHRGSACMAVMYLPIKRLTNWRAKLVGHPFVIAELGNVWHEQGARRMAAWFQFTEAAEHAKRVGLALAAPGDALLYASYFGLVDEMQEALDRGAEIDVQRGEETPLALTVGQAHMEATRLLVARGADLALPRGGYPSAFAMAMDLRGANTNWLAMLDPHRTGGPYHWRPDRLGTTWRF